MTTKQQAKQIAIANGHTLGRYEQSEYYTDQFFTATCKTCGRTVRITANSYGVSIDGLAITENCTNIVK